MKPHSSGIVISAASLPRINTGERVSLLSCIRSGSNVRLQYQISKPNQTLGQLSVHDYRKVAVFSANVRTSVTRNVSLIADNLLDGTRVLEMVYVMASRNALTTAQILNTEMSTHVFFDVLVDD